MYCLNNLADKKYFASIWSANDAAAVTDLGFLVKFPRLMLKVAVLKVTGATHFILRRNSWIRPYSLRVVLTFIVGEEHIYLIMIHVL